MPNKTDTAVPQICEHCAVVDGRRAGVLEMIGGGVCESCGYAPNDARQIALDQLRRTVYRALDAGANHTEIRELVTELLNTLPPYQRIPKALITWPDYW